MREERNFLGETPSERKGRRRQDLIEAALSLVHEGGLPMLGVRSVTTKAGLSSRYFYENFASIDDLVIAASQSVIKDLVHVGLTQLRGPAATGREILSVFRGSVDAALGMMLDDPRKIAVMMAAAAGGPKVRQAFQQNLTQLLVDVMSTDTRPAYIGFNQATTLFAAGGVSNLALAFVSGDLALSRGEIVDRMAELTLGVTAAGVDRPTI